MINKRLALAGISAQTVKGTPVIPPTFGFGLTDGRAIEVPITQDVEEITGLNPEPPGANRTGAQPGIDLTTRAFPKSIGLLLYAALGTKLTTGPVSTVYTHVLTRANDMIYMTLFGRQGTDYVRVADAKIDELTLSWEEAGPLEVAFKAMGRTVLIGTAWTATNLEVDSGGKFRSRGGTFKVDSGAAAPPAVAFVKSGEITISRELDVVQLADSIIPGDVVPSGLMVSTKLTIVPENLDEWRKIVAATTGGTAVSEAEVYGSFDHKFIIDANTDLQIAVPKVSFTADFPDADPSGGALEIELEGEMVTPTAGEPITATLRNTQVSY